MRVYVCVTKGGLKTCVYLHLSVFICVCKCARVYLCVAARTHNMGGLKVG